MRSGRIDSDAGAAVLGAAGHTRAACEQRVADLTVREIQVLRLLARGHTAPQIARALGVSAKTASNHIQNLYGKISVHTRARATLFAIEHGLVSGSPDP
jgi:DNA-binding NarL/FixJ family response regulator